MGGDGQATGGQVHVGHLEERQPGLRWTLQASMPLRSRLAARLASPSLLRFLLIQSDWPPASQAASLLPLRSLGPLGPLDSPPASLACLPCWRLLTPHSPPSLLLPSTHFIQRESSLPVCSCDHCVSCVCVCRLLLWRTDLSQTWLFLSINRQTGSLVELNADHSNGLMPPKWTSKSM